MDKVLIILKFVIFSILVAAMWLVFSIMDDFPWGGPIYIYRKGNIFSEL